MPEVAVVFGGPSPEHDVSVLTGLQACRGFASDPASANLVHALFWSKTGDWFEVDPGLEAEAFVEGVPRGARPLHFTASSKGGFAEAGRLGRSRPLTVDAALLCCHGGPGEDGTLQGALDLAGVPYAGPTVAGAALGMDKLAFAALMAASGLPTLPRVAALPDGEPPRFAGPYIVKPRFGGSSIGIDVVQDWATVLARLSANPHLRFGAVVEPYRPDLFDLQVAVRSWPKLELSAIERPLRAEGGGAGEGHILDYRDKYVAGEGMAGARRELPARIPDEVGTALRDAASAVATVCGVRGMARVDFLSDGEQVLVNEVNTIPGSLARYLWVEPAVPFAVLLADLVDEAVNRPTHAYSAAGADGSVLRSAGSIAGKLA